MSVKRDSGLFHLDAKHARTVLQNLRIDPRTMIYGECPPEESRTIQGELCRGPWGHYFYYTFAAGPMRWALEEAGRHAWGLEVLMLLRANVDPSSLDDIMELLDEYPDHVVEFTSFTVPVGRIPGRQTLIWEVRKY
jgi:hypothetical protein